MPPEIECTLRQKKQEATNKPESAPSSFHATLLVAPLSKVCESHGLSANDDKNLGEPIEAIALQGQAAIPPKI